MYKKIILFLIFGFLVLKSYSQNFEWLKGAPPNSVTEGTDIKLDKSRNIYVLGRFFGPVNFNGNILNGSGIGFNEIFIAKYDSIGTFLWAKEAGTNSQNIVPSSLEVDDSGSVYLTGLFADSINIDTISLKIIGYGIFICKYSTDGNILWAKSVTASPLLFNVHDWGDLAISKSGFIYLMGSFGNDTIIIGLDSIPNVGVARIFVIKYDSNGNVVWIQNCGGTNFQTSGGIVIDSIENIFITGGFNDSFIFGNDTLSAIGGINDEDIFLAKFDSSGTKLWATRNGVANSTDRGQVLAVGLNGDLFVSGIRSGATKSFFISKYDSIGNLLWNVLIPTGLGSDGNIYRITTDNFGYPYIIGSFEINVDFLDTYLTCTNYNSLLIKFDTSGNLLWVRQGNGDYNIGLGLCVDNFNNVYGSGRNYDSITFGQMNNPYAGYYFFKLNSSGASYYNFLPIAIFDTINTANLTSNSISCLISDSVGTIYIGTRHGGVVTNDVIVWKSYHTGNSGIISDSVNWVFKDLHDSIWICTQDSGVQKFDSLDWSTVYNTSNSGIASNHITCGVAKGDTLIFGTTNNGISMLINDSTWKNKNMLNSALPSNSITALLTDDKGKIWIGTEGGGLIKYNGLNNMVIFNNSNSGLPDDTVQCLTVDKNGTLWIGTRSNGIARYDTAGWKMYNSINTTLPDNNIKTIMADSTGRIFAGTYSKGIGVFNGLEWKMINKISGLPDTSITTIINVNGICWGGTKDSGLFKFSIDSLDIYDSICNGVQVNLGNDSILCDTGSITLDAGNGFIKYLWSNGSTTQTISANSSGFYAVSVTHMFGCTAEDTIHLIINAHPIDSLGNDTSFCGGSLILNAQNQGSNYIWNDGSTNQSLTANTSGIYTVTVTNSYSCTSKDSISITIFSLPTATITVSGLLAFCPGDSLQLTANTMSAFLWNTGATTQNIFVSDSGNYLVTVTDLNGCTNVSATYTVTVNPLPGPLQLVYSNNFIIVTPVTATDSIQWFYQGLSTPGANDSLLCIGVGNYYCIVANSFGCTGESDSIYIDPCTVGIIELNDLTSFSVYPNPGSDKIRIIYHLNKNSNIKIQLFDLMGELKISEYLKDQPKGENTFSLDGKHLSDGIYFLQVMAVDRILSGKIVVSH